MKSPRNPKQEKKTPKGKFYWIKSDGTENCPLCGAELKGCHVGDYCSNEKCKFVDGIAFLTPFLAKKYKDKIQEPYKFPDNLKNKE